MNVDMRILTSLDKVFYDEAPVETSCCFQGFQNEKISFQLAYHWDQPVREEVKLEVQSPIQSCITIRQVRQVPVERAIFEGCEEDCLRTAPGLYPDLLTAVAPHQAHIHHRWYAYWFQVRPDEHVLPGVYPVDVTLKNMEDQVLGKRSVQVEILPGTLPAQRLIHTKWFHADCLADYYQVPVWSEKHWEIVENFIRAAVDGGINMILMPVHTLPLDTRVGGERTTCQLVEVEVRDGVYAFDMTRVRRWIQMCKRCGVQYYEIAHLFTQWGAGHAPKIVAKVNGEEKRIFGWDTDAAGEAYGAFLRQYVPAIRQVLREEGIEEKTVWHISDEPSEDHLPAYRAARGQVEDVLKGCRIMDALSHFEFYQQGVVESPIVASDEIKPFLEAQVPGLWTYYCCGQVHRVSNMFIAYPSYRNRILGVQLFKHDIEGFLQWGYNFYNCQYSDYPIDPYVTTDADGWVPAGDPFQVYPGANGMPEESVRMAVTAEAMQDVRALEKLAELAGRQFVLDLIDEHLETPVSFSEYPRNKDYILNLRRRVNAEIVKRQ